MVSLIFRQARARGSKESEYSLVVPCPNLLARTRSSPEMDIPRIFNITESAHRIHNPFTAEKLATLGAALHLEAGTRVLDLGSGSGEMLCT